MKKIFLYIIIPIIVPAIIFAQEKNIYNGSLFDTTETVFGLSQVPNPVLVDSLNPRSQLWLPLTEIVGLNLALGAFNRYVTDSEFAKISWETIGDNFKSGFGWDADKFSTNMFEHPFHGSIYYNLARSNGYNYWESMAMTAFGSWQWEFFMENEPPAYNDWIQTSLGGSMLGEMFYRMSSYIIDESATGAERTWRELGIIFNPGRLFNRLIHGRTARHTSALLYEKEPRTGILTLGTNNMAEGTDFEAGTSNLMFTFEYTYGRPFIKKRRKPFDLFRLNIGINFWEQDFIGFVYAYGLMAGKNYTFRKKHKFLLGIFHHFDYLSNNVYQVGASRIGGGAIYKFPKVRDVELLTSMHVNVILMGGVNSIYATEYKYAPLDSARNYNMGMGMSGKFEAFLSMDIGNLYIGYLLYWLHTMQGAPGDEFIGIIKPRLRIYLSRYFDLGFEYLLYYRRGVYKDFQDIDWQNNEQRLFLAYKF